MVEKPSHEGSVSIEGHIKDQILLDKTPLEKFTVLSRRLINVSNSEVKSLLDELKVSKKKQNAD